MNLEFEAYCYSPLGEGWKYSTLGLAVLFKFLARILICQKFENWLHEMWERCSCVRSTAKAGDSGDTIRKTQIDYRLPNHSELIPVLTLNEFTTLLHFKLLPLDTSPILDLAFHRLCHFGFTILDTVPELWIFSSVLVPIQTGYSSSTLRSSSTPRSPPRLVLNFNAGLWISFAAKLGFLFWWSLTSDSFSVQRIFISFRRPFPLRFRQIHSRLTVYFADFVGNIRNVS